MKCPICSIEYTTNKGLSYHFTHSHNLDYITYLVEHNMINVPNCKNCNNFIDVISKKSKGRAQILNSPEKLLYCSNDCKHTDEEYRKKMSAQGVTNAHFMVDRVITDEEREMRRQQMLEQWQDPAHRAKVSATMTGVAKSPEHCANISKGRKGIIFSEEHCNNISLAVSNAYVNGNYFGQKIKYYSIKLQKELYLMSSYEFKFALLLDLIPGVEYKYQWTWLHNKELKTRYVPDFWYKRDGVEYFVEIDRYKGFKEAYGYGWKIEYGKMYAKEHNMEYLYYDITDIDLYKADVKIYSDILDSIISANIEYKELIEKFLSE